MAMMSPQMRNVYDQHDHEHEHEYKHEQDHGNDESTYENVEDAGDMGKAQYDGEYDLKRGFGPWQ